MPSTNSGSLCDRVMCDRVNATRLIKLLLVGFPHLDAHDPEGYACGLVTIASLFPENIVTEVVARGFQFPPSFYEFRQALEKLAQAQWRRQRVAERDLPALEHADEKRPTLAELEQQCLDAGIDIRPHRRIQKAIETAIETAEQVRQRYGLTREQWDAIPDRKPKD